uniref:E3 ubiquitin-protein ligase synoviolin-like TPR repeats domain-containing protein n=1 Tax=Otus sunia TaxID=257818 RepID=A0A8C8E6K0_9STRI
MLCTAAVMAGSLALTTAVVAHAYYLKHQFYPTVVYLTKSSPSMAVKRRQRRVLLLGGDPGTPQKWGVGGKSLVSLFFPPRILTPRTPLAPLRGDFAPQDSFRSSLGEF